MLLKSYSVELSYPINYYQNNQLTVFCSWFVSAIRSHFVDLVGLNSYVDQGDFWLMRSEGFCLQSAGIKSRVYHLWFEHLFLKYIDEF